MLKLHYQYNTIFMKDEYNSDELNVLSPSLKQGPLYNRYMLLM